jgi:hypothetical protein
MNLQHPEEEFDQSLTTSFVWWFIAMWKEYKTHITHSKTFLKKVDKTVAFQNELKLKTNN